MGGNYQEFALIKNYRHIATLSNSIFEMNVHTILLNKVKNFISPNQHGSVALRSTVSNLIEFTQFISSDIDNKDQVDVAYSDFSRAFYKIIHELQHYKLDHLGFSDRFFQS